MKPLSPKCALDFASEAYNIEFTSHMFTPSSRLTQYFNFDGKNSPLQGQTGVHLKKRNSNFVLTAEGKSNGKHNGSLVLAFRGTNFGFAADILTDLHAALKGSPNGSLAHAGFVNVFNSIKTQLANYLSNSVGKTKIIHCVGHSLGGAVASICADWIKANYKIQVYLYTFGAPRVGLNTYAAKSSHANIKIYRCTNGADPVPMLPLWPFIHAPLNKPEYRLNSSSGVKGESHKLYSQTGYANTLTSDSWSHLNRAAIHNLNKPERFNFHNRHQVTFTQRWADKIASGIATLLKDARYGALVTAQGLIVSGLTFYDLLAKSIEKIAKSSQKLEKQTKGLLGHMLVFAGKAVHEITDLSYKFIKWVFDVTVGRLYRAAIQALK